LSIKLTKAISITHLINFKHVNTLTETDGNLCSDLGQAQICCGVKPVNEVTKDLANV